MRLTAQWHKFVGFGVTWNRRSKWEYGWVAFALPFVEIVCEWDPIR